MRFASRCLIAAIICLPSVAIAQAPKTPAPPAAPAVPANPERTTASFGDWVMRCESVGTPAKRVCEAAQIITVQGQTAPIAQIAVGRSTTGSGKQMTLVLPTNIDIAAKPQVSIAKAGAVPVELTWQRCTPGGCFASAPVTEDILATFGAQTEPGKFVFKDAADREIVVPLSFRGLSQALAALAKES